jgi:hypothetical protein
MAAIQSKLDINEHFAEAAHNLYKCIVTEHINSVKQNWVQSLLKHYMRPATMVGERYPAFCDGGGAESSSAGVD